MTISLSSPLLKTTQELLQTNQQFAANYRDRLTNHLSMALIALDKNGADEQRLQQFYNHYIQRLEQTCRPKTALQQSHPKQCHYGDRTLFHTFEAFYVNELNTKSTEQTLNEQLPSLVPGIAGAAFHAIIRLAYAIESNDQTEIASALAYWATEYQPLGHLTYSHQYDANEQLQIAHQIFQGHLFPPGIIVDRVEHVIRHEKYKNFSSVPHSLSIEQIAKLTLTHYAHSNHFTLLHGVTAFQALMTLLPYINSPPQAVDYFWQAYVTTYATATSDYQHLELQPVTDAKWQDLQLRSIQSDDDHTIKLTYSCAILARLFPFDMYKQAVEMRLTMEEL